MRTAARPSHFSVPDHEPPGKYKCAIFFVECLVNLPTGNYALYTASNGRRIWTHNYGYQPSDMVGIYYQEGAGKPEKVIVNGKQIDVTE